MKARELPIFFMSAFFLAGIGTGAIIVSQTDTPEVEVREVEVTKELPPLVLPPRTETVTVQAAPETKAVVPGECAQVQQIASELIQIQGRMSSRSAEMVDIAKQLAKESFTGEVDALDTPRTRLTNLRSEEMQDMRRSSELSVQYNKIKDQC